MNNAPRRLSKRLSYVLRHDPASIGIQLDANGWVAVEELLGALNAHGQSVSRGELDQVVADNDKQRFKIVDDRIRASQGHSIAVDLLLTAVVPAANLYHGTAEKNLPSIRRSGLHPAGRQLVHLSDNRTTARQVGARHGLPVVLVVDTTGMCEAGFEFFRADNGVWLTAQVPVRFLTF